MATIKYLNEPIRAHCNGLNLRSVSKEEVLRSLKDLIRLETTDELFKTLLNYFDILISSPENQVTQYPVAKLYQFFRSKEDAQVLEDDHCQSYNFGSLAALSILNHIKTERLLKNLATNIPIKQKKDHSNQTWNYSQFSITGCHTVGVNSDVACVPTKKTRLLAVVADGVSGPLFETRALTGRGTAKSFVKILQERTDRLFEYPIAEFSDKAFNETTFAKWIEAAYQVILDLDKEDRTKEMRKTKEQFFPASDLTEVSTEGDSIKGCTTVAAAYDLGDKIALVQVGDSDIFAYNEQGIIPETDNGSKVDQDFIKSSVGYEFDGTDYQTGLGEREISVKFIEKKKVKGIVIASDGVRKNLANKSFDEIIREAAGQPKSIEGIITKAFKDHELNDDSTIVVLENADYKAAA